MRLLIDIFDTRDLSLLLIEPNEDVEPEYLRDVFDEIMIEYQKLSGDIEYARHFQKLDTTEWEKFKIESIKIIIEFITWGFKEDAQELITEFNLKIKLSEKLIDRVAIKKLTSIYKSINNRLKVKAAKEKEELERSDKTPVTWEDKMIYIHRSLGVMPDYNCTVALCLSYEKQAKAINQIRK